MRVLILVDVVFFLAYQTHTGDADGVGNETILGCEIGESEINAAIRPSFRLGSGRCIGTMLGQIGIVGCKPLTTMRETTEACRAMWRGGEVTFPGVTVTINHVILDVVHVSGRVPAPNGAIGPKALRETGAVAADRATRGARACITKSCPGEGSDWTGEAQGQCPIRSCIRSVTEDIQAYPTLRAFQCGRPTFG
jgi:hypothetical protein